nr:immunoglobulin light chain junction region [Macaca mulatta]
CLQYYISPFTF